MDRKEYLRAYRKAHYVKSSKTSDRLAKELVVSLYHAMLDAGKIISVYDLQEDLSEHTKNELIGLIFEGWTDITIFDQALIGQVVSTSQMTISRDFKKFVEQGYFLDLGSYHLDGYTYASGAYMLNKDKIINDCLDTYFDCYNELGQKYYDLITCKDKESIKLNNKCMTDPLWIEVKSLIDEFNKLLPDASRPHFLEQNEDGNYQYGRYYSDICNTKNPEKHVGDTSRQEKLIKYFGIDTKFIELDVNSMMLRTVFNLINNKHLSRNADVYYELYVRIVSNPMTQKAFKFSDLRDYIKSEVMPIFMDPRSVYCKINSKQKYVEELNVQKHLSEMQYRKAIESSLKCTYEQFLTKLKEAVYDLLSVYDFDCDKRILIGPMYFKYEAIIYYYMRKLFRDKGINTINVYDGFYFVEDTCDNDLFYDVYHEAIDLTKKLLVKHNHDLVSLYGKEFKLKNIKHQVTTNFDTKNVINKKFIDSLKAESKKAIF